MTTQVNASFSATGVSGILDVRGEGGATVTLSGTFSGTVYIEKDVGYGQSWQRARSPLVNGVVTTIVPKVPGSRYRLNCTDYTSGTANCVMQTFSSNPRVLSADAQGAPLVTVSTAGVTVAGDVVATGASTSGSETTALGSSAGTAVASIPATEAGTDIVHKTTLTLSGNLITVADATAYANLELYDFFSLSGLTILSCGASLAFAVTSDRATTINANAGLDWSIGSAVASSATLTSTMADIVPKVDHTLNGAVAAYTAAVTGYSSAVAVQANALGNKMFLNVGFPTGTDIDADGTMTVSGTITIIWCGTV